MATVYEDIEEDEVLWITPQTCYLTHLPNGFALRVDKFLGWDYGSPELGRVWVRGSIVLNARGESLGTLELCVPVNQPRAVITRQLPAPAAPPPTGADTPTRAVGTASAGASAHRVHRNDAPDEVRHAGRRYRRVL